MKTNVMVVVPNWNGEDLLSSCLRSLEKQTAKCKVIAVDNGSVDGSVALVEKKFPNVHIIKLPSNQGFTGGVNAGIEYAIKQNATYVATFNNDAEAKHDWLEELLITANEHQDAGITTGKLLEGDRVHIDSTGDFCRSNGMPHPRGRGEKDKGQYDKSEFVFGASGGASLYRVKMLKEIGLFDQDFFAYFEDVDLSFRAQLAGWKVRYTPEAIAYHHRGSTSKKMGDFARYQSIKNYIYLYNKNMPGGLFWKHKLSFFWKLTRMKLGAIRDGKFLVFLRAFFAAAWSWRKTINKRRKVQAMRKVDIGYIENLLKKGDHI